MSALCVYYLCVCVSVVCARMRALNAITLKVTQYDVDCVAGLMPTPPTVMRLTQRRLAPKHAAESAHTRHQQQGSAAVVHNTQDQIIA